MWLRDSLPPLARGTRVLLYGYDARAHRGGNPATVEGLAISLISQLRVVDRASLAAKPVVFVAYALAGVVLKQALIELANSGQTEMFILKTVRSCLFLGVPDSYPGQEILASMVGNSRFKHLLAELDTNPNYLAKLDRMMTGIAQSQNISIFSDYDMLPDGLPEVSPVDTLECTVTNACATSLRIALRLKGPFRHATAQSTNPTMTSSGYQREVRK
jgi:hypothetical protein